MKKEIEKVISEYHDRMRQEKKLMQELPLEEGMKRRDEFLLSVGKETAIFLNQFIRAAKPQCILELGTSYGYSTLWMAEAAYSYGGKIISLELDKPKSAYAKSKLQEAGLGVVVDFVCGDAIEYLKKTEERFDFVLLDIWKELYTSCFDLFLPKLNEDGYVISDNILQPAHHRAEMEEFVKHLKNTKAFDSVLIPIGSGFELSKRIN